MDQRDTLNELRNFVAEEHQANQNQLIELWQRPLREKLEKGQTQAINKVVVEGANHLVVTLGEGESRFREGDMVCLHRGDAMETRFILQATIEAEHEGEWLLRTTNQDLRAVDYSEPLYCDGDAMDLKPFYDKALNELANTNIGRNIILPLLAGELSADQEDTALCDAVADAAEDSGLNEEQAEAAGIGVAAKYLACIQGPPGTGKTKVISYIAKCLVERGERVLLTSHTHMAINNALNKVAEASVPVAKVCAPACVKGLNEGINRFDHGSEWEDRPDSGYVIGATPFATCTNRLENFQFDTVIFDEASQITVPLAVMAMRKARRFVFVGDHKQLPPVVLSKSVLNKQSLSVFSRLILNSSTPSVMLDQTYRMNAALTLWPSQTYYQNKLTAFGSNAQKIFMLAQAPSRYQELLSGGPAFTFIPSPGVNCKTFSAKEADLVVDIIQSAVDCGLDMRDVGVVTPYRNHGKAIKKRVAQCLGYRAAKLLVTDTVERMQGQEREMVIISLCTTDSQFLSAISEFFFQSERLNVAITRPKTKLILIGPKLDEDFSTKGESGDMQQEIANYRSLVANATQYAFQ